jgi:biofilm protein TabA
MAIIGNLHKIEKFLDDKNLDAVFKYFKQAIDKKSEVYNRILSLPVGAFEKVHITNEIFALEQVFYTKDREQCFIESHQKYIDFQLIIQGDEQMEYIDIDKLKVESPYEGNKDLITYKMVDNTSKFLLQDSDLAVFFPDDAHIGLPKAEEVKLVYKTVVKLPLELYR